MWNGKNIEVERRERSEWERVRWLGYIQAAPYAKKGTMNRPTDLIRFPWEKIETRDEWLKRHEHLKPIWDKLEKLK